MENMKREEVRKKYPEDLAYIQYKLDRRDKK